MLSKRSQSWTWNVWKKWSLLECQQKRILIVEFAMKKFPISCFTKHNNLIWLLICKYDIICNTAKPSTNNYSVSSNYFCKHLTTTINTFLPERKQFFLSTNLFLLRFGSIIADKNIEVSITNRRKNKIHSQIRSEFPKVGGKYIGFINYF